MTLTELHKKQPGQVIAIEGGLALCSKLEGLGIRKGVSISRISSQLFKGPVIVSVNGHHTALGWGIASRVHVALVAPNNGVSS